MTIPTKKPVITKKLVVAPSPLPVVPETFFGDDFWNSQKISPIKASTTLHDAAKSLQLASIIADILDEVRFEYRMSSIRKGIIQPGELAYPFTFRASELVLWIEAYYKKYHLKNNPDCFFAGTEDPKITTTFNYYYRAGCFSSVVVLGKLLAKHYDTCKIVLASNSGNTRRWLLNPPPETRGEKETVVEQEPDQEEEDLGDES